MRQRRDRHKKKDIKNHNWPLDEAKDLTGRKSFVRMKRSVQEEAGVLPEDSISDKYIKQHREEIEARQA